MMDARTHLDSLSGESSSPSGPVRGSPRGTGRARRRSGGASAQLLGSLLALGAILSGCDEDVLDTPGPCPNGREQVEGRCPVDGTNPRLIHDVTQLIVPRGQQRTLTVTSVGDVELILTADIEEPAGFVCARCEDEHFLAPGASIDLLFRFDDAAPASTHIVLRSNDERAGSLRLPLHGVLSTSDVLRAEPPILDFGFTQRGAQTSLDVRIVGGEAIGGVELRGQDAAYFEVSPAGDSRYGVTLSPPLFPTRRFDAELVARDADGQEVRVPLRGTSLGCEIPTGPSDIDGSRVVLGPSSGPVSVPITVQNPSLDTLTFAVEIQDEDGPHLDFTATPPVLEIPGGSSSAGRSITVSFRGSEDTANGTTGQLFVTPVGIEGGACGVALEGLGAPPEPSLSVGFDINVERRSRYDVRWATLAALGPRGEALTTQTFGDSQTVLVPEGADAAQLRLNYIADCTDAEFDEFGDFLGSVINIIPVVISVATGVPVERSGLGDAVNKALSDCSERQALTGELYLRENGRILPSSRTPIRMEKMEDVEEYQLDVASRTFSRTR